MKSISQQLPVPTTENPLAQLDFLINKFIQRATSQSTKKTYKASLKHFSTFLLETNNKMLLYDSKLPFFFDQHIHVYTLVNFREYLFENYFNLKSERTIYSYIYSISTFIDYAYDHGLIQKRPYPVKTFIAQRATDAYSPYSKRELSSIIKAVNSETEFYDSHFICGLGYVKSGLGIDPREVSPVGKDALYGWNADNTVWYFENVMNAIPIPGTKENLLGVHRDFFLKGILRYPGKIKKFYADRNVIPIVNLSIVGLYVLKLAIETGMNPESIMNLKMDCYQDSHPLTGRPYIRYTKLRSGGDKELVFFGDDEIEYLNGSQAKIIGRTISKVLELTKEIRVLADDSCKQYLFIYQSDSRAKFYKVLHFDRKSSYNYCKYLIKKYSLLDDKGKPLRLWLVRFRSTLITEMIRMGKNIFEVLAQAGHKRISTTMDYIYRNNLEVDYQHDISVALTTIHNNLIKVKDVDEQKRFKGLISDCIDIFNPPDLVRNRAGENVSIVCNRVHHCLSCPNSIVTKAHLPILYKYYTDIIASTSFQEGVLIFQKSYEKTVAIIEHIFSSKSFFSEAELEYAKTRALELPYLFIDHQVSAGYEYSEKN